jgi:hypothetical protein
MPKQNEIEVIISERIASEITTIMRAELDEALPNTPQ